MDKVYNLTIDTKLKTYQKIYGIKQFENNVVLNIQLVQNSTPVNLSGCTVRLNYQNKNEVLLQMANIISEKEGKVRVTVLTKVLDTIGDTPVDISVFDSEQRKITSSTFVLVVQESIYSNDKVEQEELDLIQDIYNKEKERQEAENTRKDNENKRISNESERALNESTRENQEKERQANELERIENENLRKTDEQQRVKQENKREDNEKIRINGEDSREKSMTKIQDDWQVIKDDLLNLEGGGDMMKSIYDTNKNGIVDNSEKLGGKSPEEYIQKNAGTTWNDINVNESVETGNTPALGLSRPDVSDKVLLKPINDNFTKLDSALERLGAGDIKTLSDVSIPQIQESGIYLIDNLINPPDIPEKDNRQYLVEIYKTSGGEFRCPRILSYGTGKIYYYTQNGYEDIPCTSPYQPENLYIDSQNGNDDNDGSEQKPVKTWKCAYSRIPKILTKPIFIRLRNLDSSTNLTISNISYIGEDYYSTKLQIDGNNISINTIQLINCDLGAAEYGMNIFDLKCTKFIIDNSSSCRVRIVSDNITCQDSYLMCDKCQCKQYTSRRRGYVNVVNHITPSSPGKYGCYSEWGGYMYVEGNKPTGTSGDKYEAHGGKVEIIE